MFSLPLMSSYHDNASSVPPTPTFSVFGGFNNGLSSVPASPVRPGFLSTSASPLALPTNPQQAQSQSISHSVVTAQTIVNKENASRDTRFAQRLFQDDEQNSLDTFFSQQLYVQPGMSESPVEREQATSTETKRKSVHSKNAKGSTAKVAIQGSNAKVNDGDNEPTLQPPSKRVKTIAANDKIGVKAEDGASLSPSDQEHAPKRGGKRSNHIASEQRRRSTIKDNYKALVDILLAGEESSGITLANAGEGDDAPGESKKSKAKGRGRGRKGQDGAGATKSVVLDRVAAYIRWLERGNEALQTEIGRLEVAKT